MTKYKSSWTPERRAAARERALQNKPWEKSTGPRTKEGKKISSGNAFRHGYRSGVFLEIEAYLRDQRVFLRETLKMDEKTRKLMSSNELIRDLINLNILG